MTNSTRTRADTQRRRHATTSRRIGIEALVVSGLLALLTVPAGAHRDPVSFAWISSSGAVQANHTPTPHYRQHDGGWGIVSLRQSTGVYTVRFSALRLSLLTRGHVRVTAYGSSPTSCQVASWFEDDVHVACFDASGMPADSPFTVAYLDTELDHTDEYAWLWSQLDGTSSFIADPLYVANGEAAQFTEYTVNRLATGLYDVDFATFGVFESIPSVDLSIQVGAYGPAFARCKLDGFDHEHATVRCQNAAGLAQDSRFVLLATSARYGSEGMAYARVHDGSASAGTAAADRASVPGGGSIAWTRSTTGVYSVGFDGYGSYGINGGTAHVTADGSDDAWCKVAGWSSDDVNVRCFDQAGAPADSEFTVFYHKTPRRAFNQEYAFGSAVQPTTASYAAEPERTYSAAGGAVSFGRSGVGAYTASFSGMGNVGSDGGVVLVSMSGSSLGYCKPVSWGSTTASVHCYDPAGLPADRPYDALYWKPTEGAQGVAYAWASQPTTASYSPSAVYAFNPTGAPITIARLGVGHYAVTWQDYGDTILGEGGAYTGHPQVNAYGTGNHRCNTGPMSVDGDTIEVYCFDVTGSAVDTPFVALYVKSNRFYAGLHYVRGYLDPLVANYTTDTDHFGFSPNRIGAGRYSSNFYDLAPSGVGAQRPHTQISARESSDLRCTRATGIPYKASAFLMDVDCWITAGAYADAHYDLMVLTPQAVPEPDAGQGLTLGACALCGLVAVARRRAAIAPRARAE